MNQPAAGRQDLRVRCPGCATDFVCRIQAGYSTCWCYELPNVCPVDADPDAGCLCRTCLEARIDEITRIRSQG